MFCVVVFFHKIKRRIAISTVNKMRKTEDGRWTCNATPNIKLGNPGWYKIGVNEFVESISCDEACVDHEDITIIYMTETEEELTHFRAGFNVGYKSQRFAYAEAAKRGVLCLT